MVETKLIETYKDGQLKRLLIFIGHLEALDEMLDEGTINRVQFADQTRELMKELSISMDQLEEKILDVERRQQIEEQAHPG